MKIADRYKAKGIYSDIFVEASRTNRRGNKVPYKWRAVFAFLTPRGDWDVSAKKSTDREELNEWLDDQKHRLRTEGSKLMAHRKGSFAEFAEDYKYNLKMRDLATFDEECQKVDLMMQYFKDVRLQDVDYDAITGLKHYLLTTPQVTKFYRTDRKTGEKYVSKVREIKRTKTTVNRYLSRLKDLLGEAENSKKISAVPSFKRLIEGSAEKARTQSIAPNELIALLQTCEERISGHDAKGLVLPLIAGYETGARVGELKVVKRRGKVNAAGEVIEPGILYVDHDRKSGVIAMPIEKTRPTKHKKVPIPRRLYDAMTAAGVWEMDDDELVFPISSNYRHTLKTRLERAGLDTNFHFHALRAVNNTNRRFANQSRDDLQAQVGHAKGSRMSETHYFRPDYIQLMNSIESYDKYVKERFEDVLDAELE